MTWISNFIIHNGNMVIFFPLIVKRMLGRVLRDSVTLLFPFLFENCYCSLLPLQIKQIQWSADMCNLMDEEWKIILHLSSLYHRPFLCVTAKRITPNFIEVYLLLGANPFGGDKLFGVALTCFLEALGAVRTRHIFQLTRALRFKDSSWKCSCWACLFLFMMREDSL